MSPYLKFVMNADVLRSMKCSLAPNAWKQQCLYIVMSTFFNLIYTIITYMVIKKWHQSGCHLHSTCQKQWQARLTNKLSISGMCSSSRSLCTLVYVDFHGLLHTSTGSFNTCICGGVSLHIYKSLLGDIIFPNTRGSPPFNLIFL